MTKQLRATVVALLMFVWGYAQAADINGTFTASFETQVGTQAYTFEFQVAGEVLTGTAKSTVADVATEERALADGKVVGNAISFTETFSYQGMPLTITYTGEIVSDDEIRFKREVAGTPEEFVAMRKK
jgi:hypothetical protein